MTTIFDKASQYRCVHCTQENMDGPDCLCSQDRGRVLRIWGEEFRLPPPSPESSLPPVQEDYLPPKRRALLPTPAWRPIPNPTPPPIIRRGPLLPTPTPTQPTSTSIPELLEAGAEEVKAMLAR